MDLLYPRPLANGRSDTPQLIGLKHLNLVFQQLMITIPRMTWHCHDSALVSSEHTHITIWQAGLVRGIKEEVTMLSTPVTN